MGIWDKITAVFDSKYSNGEKADCKHYKFCDIFDPSDD